MFLDVAEMTSRQRYKMMASTILPRPIALVTSMDADGILNAAPFSFFNAVADDPPTIVIGFQPHPDGSLKDTPRNIRARGEFVVNLVNQDLAQKMNICATGFSSELSEPEEASLDTVASEIVEIPRIADSPVSLECRRRVGLDLGQGRVLEVGDVVAFHVRDDLIDFEKLHVAGENADLIARMHGADWYAKTTDLFRMARD